MRSTTVKTGLFVCNLACEWRFKRMRALRVTNRDMVENNALPARRIRLDHLGPKLDPFDRKGPFPIIRVHTNNTVTVQRGQVHERLSIRRIKPSLG